MDNISETEQNFFEKVLPKLNETAANLNVSPTDITKAVSDFVLAAKARRSLFELVKIPEPYMEYEIGILLEKRRTENPLIEPVALEVKTRGLKPGVSNEKYETAYNEYLSQVYESIGSSTKIARNVLQLIADLPTDNKHSRVGALQRKIKADQERKPSPKEDEVSSDKIYKEVMLTGRELDEILNQNGLSFLSLHFVANSMDMSNLRLDIFELIDLLKNKVVLRDKIILQDKNYVKQLTDRVSNPIDKIHSFIGGLLQVCGGLSDTFSQIIKFYNL